MFATRHRLYNVIARTSRSFLQIAILPPLALTILLALSSSAHLYAPILLASAISTAARARVRRLSMMYPHGHGRSDRAQVARRGMLEGAPGFAFKP